MVTNRGIVYVGPDEVEVQSIEFPKLAIGNRRCDHGVILKVVTTNICGTDQHMVRGVGTPRGLILGHEITGEVIEAGRDVEFIKVGDLCSVPFNIACGRCRNCKGGKTEICLNVNPGRPGAAYGYVDLGGWVGGQVEYVMVPYADFNLLKFPDKAQAMEKIRDLTCLPDILPTAYHGAVNAGIGPGSTVLIAGASTLGMAAAAAAKLLGAAVVIVADLIPERLAQAKSFGCEVVDVSKDASIGDQIAEILGEPLVDAGVDCVGFEARGHGHPGARTSPATVLNSLMTVTRAGGSIGIPGRYVTADPNEVANSKTTSNLSVRLGLGWAKSLYFFAGSCPVMKYNRQLMMAILHDRIEIAKAVNVKVLDFDQGPQGYKGFDTGAAAKFVIDPHQIIPSLIVSQASQPSSAPIVIKSQSNVGNKVLKELRVSRATDPELTVSRLTKALGPRAWMTDFVAASVYVVDGAFESQSLDNIVELALNESIEINVTAASSYHGPPSKLLLMGLYSSGAIRSIAGTMHMVGSQCFLTLEDILDLIDPDAMDDQIPLTEPLRFSIHIVPLRDALV